MVTKTPKFDKALDEIFKTLIPHEKVCFECKISFKVEKEDIDFYKMLKVPPPTLCPRCRQIRRLGILMRVPKFFKRPCNAPGHSENVITVFPPSSLHKVYDNNYWYSDSWEAELYGRDYNLNGKFFDQFRDLFFAVPHMPLERDVTSINSEYSLGGRHGKNNYYTAGAYHSEDCSFGEEVRFSKFCLDCLNVWDSEFCYECAVVDHCHRCIFTVDSEQCMDSAFLYDCKNCTNCFLSSNLRNKSYVFENKQLSKDEYKSNMAGLNLGDRTVLWNMRKRFDDILKDALRRSIWLTNATGCLGDRLVNCKNCFQTFDGIEGENLRYVQSFDRAKDAMDSSYYAGDGSNLLYESAVSAGSGSIFFSLYIRACINIEYCSECNNCQNCFGCVGLKNKKFCIFNKQYSEDNYWKTVDEIKSKMLGDKEYGELFPLALGLFPYQTSRSQKFYPINEKIATEKGIPWYNELDSQAAQNIQLKDPNKDVPADIKDVDSSILKDAIRCEITGRPFKIVEHELKFYKHMNLPIPTKHPWQRLMERAVFMHPLELFPFACPSCGEKSLSIYNEEKQKQFKIFCEKCYVKEIV